MSKVIFDEEVTYDKIRRYLDGFLPPVIIVIDNTKMVKKEELEKIMSHMKNVYFEVIGGFREDRPRYVDGKVKIKPKYKDESYTKRVTYTPSELYSIINDFEKIEKGIDKNFTETEKAMYIYGKLCDNIVYGQNNMPWLDEKGFDPDRGLRTLLYGKGVCAGIAITLEEALHRNGIEAHYQNLRHTHGWVVAKLDGKYRALELTFEISKKKGNSYKYEFFSDNTLWNGQGFYNTPYHNTKDDKEEINYKISAYSKDEIEKAKQKIFERNIRNLSVTEGKITRFYFKDTIAELTYDSQGNLKLNFPSQIKYYSKKFTRSDGSSFILVGMGKNDKGEHKYTIFENKTDDIVRYTDLTSEDNLLDLDEKFVSDYLLGRQRLKKRINSYDGNIGRLNENFLYHSKDLESSHLTL